MSPSKHNRNVPVGTLERKQQQRMTTPEQPDREAGGQWLYALWVAEWPVFSGVPHVPWSDLGEAIREHYRRLWDTIAEGFQKRIR